MNTMKDHRLKNSNGLGLRCPTCSSTNIRPLHAKFTEAALREYGCLDCGLIEDCRTDEPQYGAFLARWSDDGVVAVPLAKTDHTAALFERIVRNPDDDAVRLAYADEIESRFPEQAEFIRLQIARVNEERARNAIIEEPYGRETTLIQKHGVEWAKDILPFARPRSPDALARSRGFAEMFPGYQFERGFVELLRTDPRVIVEMGDRLMTLAPIRHLDLTNEGPFVPALTAPCLAQMRSLSFSGLGLTDVDVTALAERGHLDRCEWLDLTVNRISSRGVEALLANPLVRAMKIVILWGNPGNPAVMVSGDCHGTVMIDGLPAIGEMMERKYGRIDWLHLVPRGLPDRFHADAARPAP